MEELLLTGQAQGYRRGFAKVFVNPLFLLAFFCSILLVLHLVSHQAGKDSGIDFSSTKSTQQTVTGQVLVHHTAHCSAGSLTPYGAHSYKTLLKRNFRIILRKSLSFTHIFEKVTCFPLVSSSLYIYKINCKQLLENIWVFIRSDS